MVADLDDEPYAVPLQRPQPARSISQLLDESRPAQCRRARAHATSMPYWPNFFASMTAAEAYEEGQRRHLLNGIVSTPSDLAENKPNCARATGTSQVPFDYLGETIEFPGAPYRLPETPSPIGRPPRLGEHTEAVLATLQ